MEEAGKEIPTSNAGVKRNSRSMKLSEEEKPLALGCKRFYSLPPPPLFFCFFLFFLRSHARNDMSRHLLVAWEIYYSVFKKINQSLGAMNSLELSNISPNLQDCHNLTLGKQACFTS